ncbi:MAG: M67 family metallopeptidase [Gammaproteobacteria bacterium]|nr:M67 family metallopeptidase [Gammaproteobacteria bacterium]
MAFAAPAVVISEPLRHSLVIMAQASPAIETCALLGGRDNVITSIYPVHNVAADPAAAFLLDAKGQIAAMKLIREAGESLRGIFHSHPATAAEPSETDKAQAAYPDVYYLIASLTGPAVDLQAWYYDGRGFTRVGIDSG